MTKLRLPLTEPQSPRYIFLDEAQNRLHVLLPIVSGNRIGLDNTCQAVRSPQEFFGLSGAAGGASALESLKNYKEALEFDLDLLQKDAELTEEKSERLKQVNWYIEFFEKIKDHTLLAPLKLNFPEYPTALKKLIKSARSNLYSMILRPRTQDIDLRTVNPVFSLNRNYQNERGDVIAQASPLSEALSQVYKDIAINNKCARVIGEVLASKVGRMNDFEGIKTALSAAILSHFGKHIDFIQDKASLEAMYLGGASDDAQDYIRVLYRVAKPLLEEAVLEISPFDMIEPAQSLADLQQAKERLSILTQFFLGIANIDCVSRDKTKANWGQLLENNEVLRQELMARILLVLDTLDIEQAIFYFMKDNQQALGLETALTAEDEQRITQSFRAHYTQIKDSHYFDEFMIVDAEKPGLFVIHNNMICTNVTEFIKAMVEEDKRSQDLNTYYAQRIREDFKAINGELAHQNQLYPEGEAPSIEVELSDLNDKALRALIQRLPLDKQKEIKALPEVLNRLDLPDFLLQIAHGEEPQAESLLKTYREQGLNVQSLLLSEGRFTDYSGRTFNCTAFEYAYWAKDTYMCRMLLKHMDEHTLAELFQRIEAMEKEGLAYMFDNKEHKEPHFNFEPLKQAYEDYLAACTKIPQERGVIDRAWLDIGKQQRLLPTHVANEYCHPGRSFNPTPSFNESALPRLLRFYNPRIHREESWFPVAAAPNSGLGFDFALFRAGRWSRVAASRARPPAIGSNGAGSIDFAAVKRLDKVRTTELTSLFDQLKEARQRSGLSP